MAIWDMLKIIKVNQRGFKTIIIGRQVFYIFEIYEKNEVLFDSLIQKLFKLSIPLYWFKDYYEFETFFTLYDSLYTYNFILIF